ncbi:MAG: hypothetical protein AAF389_07940 [Gemmatimonadota bacterium]
MSDSEDEPILTLEPLCDAIREGVEGAGWSLSGMQKTTSHQFEGRWEGESTRSAYLFFHRPDGPDHVSIDVYLDETSRGLSGNLALVVDLDALGALPSAPETLAIMANAAVDRLPESVRRPVTLRYRLVDAAEPIDKADTEVRIKVRLPRSVLGQGTPATTAFARTATADFGALLDTDELRELAAPDD